MDLGRDAPCRAAGHAHGRIVVYALVVRWAYPAVGVWAGTALALGAALIWVALLRPVMARVS